MEINCQLDVTDNVFIADLSACSICFGHHYAQHQELKSIIQVGAACGIWCSTPDWQLKNQSIKYHRQQPPELLMMGIMVPETC